MMMDNNQAQHMVLSFSFFLKKLFLIKFKSCWSYITRKMSAVVHPLGANTVYPLHRFPRLSFLDPAIEKRFQVLMFRETFSNPTKE